MGGSPHETPKVQNRAEIWPGMGGTLREPKKLHDYAFLNHNRRKFWAAEFFQKFGRLRMARYLWEAL